MYNFYPKKLVQPPGCAPNILLIMKLMTLILVTSILQVSARTFAQKVTLSEKNTPLKKVFEKVSDQTSYDFLVSSENLAVAKLVTINIQNEELPVALNKIFASQPLTFVIQEKMVVVSKKENETRNQTIKIPVTITGKVTDTSGQALSGATVRIKGSQKITLTDSEGAFAILAQEGEEVEISFIGFEPFSFLTDARSTFHKIVLFAIPSKLNEVQVIGYGTVTKRLNTGSVSTLRAADIEKQPITNVISALSGRLPGVFVQTTNGLPGGAVNVQIRGQGSIAAGTNPLYIIDDVPFLSSVVDAGSTLGYGAINGAVSPLNSLNPDDIESINILKDAAATSIYGSRGANGVVLITTKKGKYGKTLVNINFNNGYSQVANLPRLLNNKQYLQIRREAYKNDGKVPSADPNSPNYAPDLMVWDTTKTTDWRKFILGGTGHVTNLQGTISGGNQNTSFLIGGNYHNESSVLPGDNGYNRAGIHMNVQHTALNNRFNVQFSTSYSADNNKLTNLTTNFTSDLLLPPNFPLYDSSGGYNYYLGFNPLADMSAVTKTATNNVVINTVLKYTVTPGLILKTTAGFNRIGINQIMTYPTNSQYVGSTNFSDFGDNSNQNLIVEPQIEYNKKIGISNLNVLVGGTYQSSVRKNQFIEATNFNSDVLLENISSATSLTVSNYKIQYKYLSVFARAIYNISDKYIFNVSIRRDGSSRFGPGDQFGTFGAIGAAWLFSNEEWFKNNMSFISFGKVRGSYGTTGNDQITDYQYLSTYRSSGNIYQGVSGLLPARIANANFHWETTRKLELALELGILQDRILLNLNWYRNRSDNQLVDYAIPYLTGFNTYQANLPATVQNSGWEFELNTKNIRSGKFLWSTTFNLTIPKNQLLSFQNLATSSYANALVIGDPITRVYGYKYSSLDPTGRPLFLKSTGEETKNPSSTDFFTLAKGYPDLYGGIGNTFQYKQWQLDVFGQFTKQNSMGGLIYTPGINQNNFINTLNRWQKPGDQTGMAKASNSYSYYFYYNLSSANVFNNSYFRLKNIALSYSLPSRWLNTPKIQQIKLYIQAQNMLTLWNRNNPFYDPETGASANIPPMKSFVAGIQITL